MKRKSLIVSTLLLAFVFGGGAAYGEPDHRSRCADAHRRPGVEAPAALDDAAWQKAKAVDVPFVGKEKFAGKKAT